MYLVRENNLFSLLPKEKMIEDWKIKYLEESGIEEINFELFQSILKMISDSEKKKKKVKVYRNYSFFILYV